MGFRGPEMADLRERSQRVSSVILGPMPLLYALLSGEPPGKSEISQKDRGRFTFRVFQNREKCNQIYLWVSENGVPEALLSKLKETMLFLAKKVRLP